MPCTDGGIPYRDSRGDTDNSRTRKLEAVLCGVLSFFRDNTVGAVTIDYIFNNMDWNEIGVTRAWAADWWAEHQREDEIRREKEAREAKFLEIRNKVLAALTADEAAAIGFDKWKYLLNR